LKPSEFTETDLGADGLGVGLGLLGSHFDGAAVSGTVLRKWLVVMKLSSATGRQKTKGRETLLQKLQWKFFR
jgi:hypothetical protein